MKKRTRRREREKEKKSGVQANNVTGVSHPFLSSSLVGCSTLFSLHLLESLCLSGGCAAAGSRHWLYSTLDNLTRLIFDYYLQNMSHKYSHGTHPAVSAGHYGRGREYAIEKWIPLQQVSNEQRLPSSSIRAPVLLTVLFR